MSYGEKNKKNFAASQDPLWLQSTAQRAMGAEAGFEFAPAAFDIIGRSYLSFRLYANKCRGLVASRTPIFRA
jgi:hypothetical protein